METSGRIQKLMGTFMLPNGFLVMGVAGSGKTAFGKTLAETLGWDFFDADDYHPPENIAKMAAGIPLNDSDREPWLAMLSSVLDSTLTARRHPILACSALKVSYRKRLLEGKDGIAVIYLKGSYDLIWSRISARTGHYMRPEMLRSQFEILEEPQNALVLDISQPLGEMVADVMRRMPGLAGG
jgi:gluconokinase